MNIALWLYQSAARFAHNPALFCGSTPVADYATFAGRAAAIAETLRNQYSIGKGDRVGLFMKNRTEYLEAIYAILWLGAVAVPINAKLHSKEAAWILANARASLVLVSDDIGAPLKQHLENEAEAVALWSVDSADFAAITALPALPPPSPCEQDDMAWLFYTSGTTGKPKGVMLSHQNLVAMSLCYPVDVDAVNASDAALYAAPISHGAGLYNFIFVRCGARHVVPASGGFDESEVLGLAKTLAKTDDALCMFAAPTMVKRLVETAIARGENGSGIKTIVYGGGPMYQADIEQAMAVMGPRFVQIYGQGESPMTITALSRDHHSETDHPRYKQRLSSVGVAQSAVQLRIADTNGNALAAGEVGEIEVKGSTVMLGYWQNPEATRNTVHDGWLRTGDMGVLDKDGFLSLRDRSKDVIISGGTNIYPREVEEVLLTHPCVQEVSVLGQQHADWGEVVVAFVVTAANQPLDSQALDQHCLDNMARFKRPKQYYAVDALPKNNNGKVEKNVLRARLQSKAPL